MDNLQSDIKKMLPVIITAGALIVAVYFWKSFYIQVESYEQAVVFQFGHAKEIPLQAGWHFRLPYPIQKIYTIDVEKDRKLEIGFTQADNGKRVHNEREALTLTRYGNLVDLEMEVNYNISDPIKYVVNDANPDLSVKHISESVLRIVVGKHSIDDVLTEKKRMINAEIHEEVQKLVEKYDLGIDINRVQFVKAVNPAQIVKAFEDVENAKQDSAKMFLDAQRYANQVLPKARGDATRQIEEAKGYAQSLITRAQGDSARFTQLLVKYQKSKAVTRKRLYLETIEAVLPKVKKFIVGQTNTTNLLPLGKL